MNIIKSFKKINIGLKLKRNISKTVVLFFLNRKISTLTGGRKDFGKLTDLGVDRKAKSISFDVIRNGEMHSLAIRNYYFFVSRGQSYLGWSSMDFDGPAREEYRIVFQEIDRIKVSNRYISMLEAVM